MQQYGRKVVVSPRWNAPREEWLEVMVDISIDIEALAQRLGQSAWRNKSKKSAAINGLIKASVRLTSAQAAKLEGGKSS